MQETESWHLRDPFGSYVSLKFYQHCFDAILSLAVALNNSIEGMLYNIMQSNTEFLIICLFI